MVDQQQVLRLQALFKSGRDKLQSFFAVLNEVRLEIGDQALPSWCFNELHIGFSVVDNIAKVLVKTDEERIRIELREARIAQRDQREQAARQRALDREAHKKRLAEERADRAKIEPTKKRRRQRQNNPNELGPKASAESQKKGNHQEHFRREPAGVGKGAQEGSRHDQQRQRALDRGIDCVGASSKHGASQISRRPRIRPVVRNERTYHTQRRSRRSDRTRMHGQPAGNPDRHDQPILSTDLANKPAGVDRSGRSVGFLTLRNRHERRRPHHRRHRR